jgi:hypothetical protein
MIAGPKTSGRSAEQRSLIRVPVRIMTKDEERAFRKNYDKIKKRLKDASEPKKQ